MGFRVAILGCGTVGGGVARILLEQNEALRQRSGQALELVRIVDLLPQESAERHGLPRELYAGAAPELTLEEAEAATQEVLRDPSVDVVVCVSVSHRSRLEGGRFLWDIYKEIVKLLT